MTEELLCLLRQLITAEATGPLGTRVEFSLIDRQDTMNQKLRLGTYGFIQGARYFVAGQVEPTREAMLDYGYLLERLILEFTRFGLGTCWLGGTFERGGFAKAIGLREGLVIPAITPVGFPTAMRGLGDRIIRLSAGSRNRLPAEQLFFDGEFSHSLDLLSVGPLKAAFEAVRLAPSASNKQPWRIIYAKERADFYLVRTPGYLNKYTSVDLQMVDIGIALSHWYLACQDLGIKCAFVKPESGTQGMAMEKALTAVIQQ